MPYNTRRKSLSLPSLGIHVPVTQAARAAAAAAAAATSKTTVRPSSSSSSSSVSKSRSPSAPALRSESPESQSHSSKRRKRSHGESSSAIEHTPPPSPTPATSVDMSDADELPVPAKIDWNTVNDDIVAAVLLQLQSTGNRPHLIKDLAVVLVQKLLSVQQSANQCAIISSRLASFMKRPCWNELSRCPLAKELEPVHPRRTYYFLTTCPRQPFPDPNTTSSMSFLTPLPQIRAPVVTPSVSLTDDSISEELEARRRELSPSPEVDLPAADFDEVIEEDDFMPATPMGSLPKPTILDPRSMRPDSPPLEKDEREFTQTADVLQKRKFLDATPMPEIKDSSDKMDYDAWFSDSRPVPTTMFLASPAMKPSFMSSARKEEDPDSWIKFSKLIEWDKGAEGIEIDELDCLLDSC